MSKEFYALGLLGAVALGCAVQPFMVPAATANSAVQTWDYFCVRVFGYEETQEKAKQSGAQGWELVTITGDEHGTPRSACFKRPL